MKTSIYITGSGISSKFTLLRQIPSRDGYKEIGFNNFRIDYPTKKEAVNALSEAFQCMRSDIDFKNDPNFSYMRGETLSYDAGSAKVLPTN